MTTPTMGPAPIVAPRVDSTQWYSGSPLAVNLHALGDGIANRNWVEAGVGALGTAAEGASALVDPIGTLASWGVGWALEHIEPLSDMMDKISGDPDAVSAYAQTWRNVASSTDASASIYEGYVNGDIASWQDPAGKMYKDLAGQRLADLHAMSAGATGMSKLADALNIVVGIVRAGVRWVISFVVGKLISLIIKVAASLGTYLPAAIVEAGVHVANAVSKVTKLMKDLFASLKKLSEMLKEYKKYILLIKVGAGVGSGTYAYKPYEA